MRHVALCALALLLAACATIGRAPERAASEAQSAAEPLSSAEEMVAYLARLGPMNPAALAAEAAAQRQVAQRNAGDIQRVKAAIALLMAHHGEESEILALVEPIVRKEIDADLKAMASFLHILATDRRRLRESSAARVREERRAQDALRSRAEAAQERAAQLQQKLDALTALEKSLSDRQPSSR